MATTIENSAFIMGAAFILIVVIIAVLYFAGRSSNLRQNYRRIFDTQSTQDSLIAFFLIYATFLITFGQIDDGLLERMILIAGLSPEALANLVGSTTTGGAFISYLGILLFGTLLFGFGLSIIVVGFLNQFFGMNLNLQVTFIIVLWATGMLLLILQLGFFLWISVFGLLYVMISAI